VRGLIPILAKERFDRSLAKSPLTIKFVGVAATAPRAPMTAVKVKQPNPKLIERQISMPTPNADLFRGDIWGNGE
jgi:hypothetical protein